MTLIKDASTDIAKASSHIMYVIYKQYRFNLCLALIIEHCTVFKLLLNPRLTAETNRRKQPHKPRQINKRKCYLPFFAFRQLASSSFLIKKHEIDTYVFCNIMVVIHPFAQHIHTC